MEGFETFQQIFSFFLSSELDTNHVRSVENTHNNGLIETVSTFHTMRTDLCTKMIEHVDNVELFNSFVGADTCLQYGTVPARSTCILSGVQLEPSAGILIVVDNRKIFTFHKRLKVIVLTFWYILNLPAELTKECIEWFRGTSRKNVTSDVTEIVNQITTHNNGMFVKRAYVRLLNSVKFVQQDMSKITVVR